MEGEAAMGATGLGDRLIVMGVSGCGKSTIGALLAEALGARFFDGDDFHPAANIAKMSRGEALTDADRWPWLDRVAAELARGPGPVVGACSALRRAYRDRLSAGPAGRVGFVWLSGDKALIAARMAARQGHFMPPGLLDSQFATLEPPGPDETAIEAPIKASTKAIVADIVARIAPGAGAP